MGKVSFVLLCRAGAGSESANARLVVAEPAGEGVVVVERREQGLLLEC